MFPSITTSCPHTFKVVGSFRHDFIVDRLGVLSLGRSQFRAIDFSAFLLDITYTACQILYGNFIVPKNAQITEIETSQSEGRGISLEVQNMHRQEQATVRLHARLVKYQHVVDCCTLHQIL
jgi:hypothetical protein